MKGSAVIKQETQLLPMDSAMRSQLESVVKVVMCSRGGGSASEA